jgi:hypothetical protein
LGLESFVDKGTIREIVVEKFFITFLQFITAKCIVCRIFSPIFLIYYKEDVKIKLQISEDMASERQQIESWGKQELDITPQVIQEYFNLLET